MYIKNISLDVLGDVIAQLVAKGLTFHATPHPDGSWFIELTGGH
jgi:hypothetical protein